MPEHSEPEPDIALVKPRRYRDAHPYPTDVLMIIEVAETSLDKDKGVKVPLYARFRIPEVWIVDMSGRPVECFWHYRSAPIYTIHSFKACGARPYHFQKRSPV